MTVSNIPVGPLLTEARRLPDAPHCVSPRPSVEEAMPTSATFEAVEERRPSIHVLTAALSALGFIHACSAVKARPIRHTDIWSVGRPSCAAITSPSPTPYSTAEVPAEAAEGFEAVERMARRREEPETKCTRATTTTRCKRTVCMDCQETGYQSPTWIPHYK